MLYWFVIINYNCKLTTSKSKLKLVLLYGLKLDGLTDWMVCLR